LPDGSYIIYADNYFGGNYPIMKWLNDSGRYFVILSRADRPSSKLNLTSFFYHLSFMEISTH